VTKKSYWWLTSIQFLLTIVVAGVFGLLYDKFIGWAIFLGGLIGCISNATFMAGCFLVPGFVSKTKKILAAFYLAEGAKFFLTILLFIAAIFYLKMPVLPLFAAYFLVYINFSLASLLLR
jgi:F0F1-type ATP synthase assembly protein I